MATTEIKAFSTATAGSGGNRLTPAAYAALTTLLADGFQAGIAQSVQVNTVLAQASFMAAGLAGFCVAQGVSVPDDGNLTNLVAEIQAALLAFVLANTGRIKLAADTTYYFSNAGNDITGNGTAGTPWATSNHAWAYITKNVDCAGFAVTLQFQGAGPYTANTSFAIAPVPANTPVTIDMAAQTISTTSADCFTFIGDGLNVTLKNMKMQTTTSGTSVTYGDGARVAIGTGVNFGAAAVQHLAGNSGGICVCANGYTISGGAINHWAVDLSSVLVARGITVTLTGTPAFTTFASSEENSSIQAISNTYSGAATGVQYIAQISATINTNGAPTNWPTGLTAGSTLTGGQIV